MDRRCKITVVNNFANAELYFQAKFEVAPDKQIIHNKIFFLFIQTNKLIVRCYVRNSSVKKSANVNTSIFHSIHLIAAVHELSDHLSFDMFYTLFFFWHLSNGVCTAILRFISPKVHYFECSLIRTVPRSTSPKVTILKSPKLQQL